MAVAAGHPYPVAAGNTINYNINLKCNGPDDAANVMVTDTLPAGVTFVSATGTDFSCSEAGGTITCDYVPEPYPNGTVTNITVVVTAPLTAGPPILFSAKAAGGPRNNATISAV